MSTNSTTSSVATEIVVMAATIGAVYVGIWGVKKLVKTGVALKTSVFSKA